MNFDEFNRLSPDAHNVRIYSGDNTIMGRLIRFSCWCARAAFINEKEYDYE